MNIETINNFNLQFLPQDDKIKPEFDFLKKAKTKFPKELHHVLDEIGHSCPASCRVRKLGSYVVGSLDSLAGAEGTFDFVSVHDGLGHIVVIFGWPWFFGRPAERLAVGFNFIDFQEVPVGLIHIYLVSENGSRKATEALFEQTSVELQVRAFNICVPTMMVNERVTIVDTYANLGAELDLCLCLATDDGSYMRLKDADDAVGASVSSIGEHLLLLSIHVKGGVERMLLVAYQKGFAARVADKKFDYLFELSVQATKHVGFGPMDKLAAFLFHLHKYEIGSADILVGSAPVTDLQHLANAMYVSVHDITTVMDNINIYGVTHLCVDIRGIHLQHSFMESAFRVLELLGESIVPYTVYHILFLAGSVVILCSGIPVIGLVFSLFRLGPAPSLLFEQPDAHFVYFLVGDALANCDKQRWIKNRLVGQLRQATHILHIRIFLDNPDGLLIIETHLVLDNHRCNDHTGWIVACDFVLVMQFGVVYLLQFGPRKSIAEYDPTVGLVKIVKRRLEDAQRQLSVFILRPILHLLSS